MRPPRRIERHPLTTTHQGRPITIQFDGKRVPAVEGEPVAVSLYVAGQTVLSRSMRYHRARGYYCGTGDCTHCFLRIDGVPNQRACRTTCAETTWCEGQNAWPSVGRDLLGASDVVYPDYLDAHHAFIRPRLLKPVYDRVIRSMAGFGRVPNQPIKQAYTRHDEDVDVLVIGAGPAGMAAAEQASRSADRVTLVDQRPRLGGRMRWQTTPFHHVDDDAAPSVDGKDWVVRAHQRLNDAGVDVRTATSVFAYYGDTWAAATPMSLLRMRAKSVVVATGTMDAYPSVANADRAGVLLHDAASQMLNEYGVTPWEPVIVYGGERESFLLIRDLVACGVRVAGSYFAEDRNAVHQGMLADVQRLGVTIHPRHHAAYVVGRRRPRAVVFDTDRGRKRVPCSTVIFSTGRSALAELVQQSGAVVSYDSSIKRIRPVVQEGGTTQPGIFAAGSLAGTTDSWQSIESGTRAGQRAAQYAMDGTREAPVAEALRA